MNFSTKIYTHTLQLLQEIWGRPIEITSIETLREGRCFRLTLNTTLSKVPKNVILKIALDEPGYSMDPDSAAPNPAQPLLEEWAGLLFLNECLQNKPFVPQFYGGDRKTGIILIEDFGQGETLAEALQGNDPMAANEFLLKHADALARLHTATLGREKRYMEIRNALGPTGAPRNWKKFGNLLATQGWGNLHLLRKDLVRSFAFIGQSVGKEFWVEYEYLTSAIHDPSPYRTYVHNDTCPDNSLLTSAGFKLIDFERSGYHHCLLDVAYYRLGMPHCYWSGELPTSVINQLEARYRQSLAPMIAEITDDRCFGNAITDACAYWIISSGIWLVDKDFGADFLWGNATWRQRVLFRLKQFSAATQEHDHLHAMGAAARETLRILLTHWNCDPLPTFPSFSTIK